MFKFFSILLIFISLFVYDVAFSRILSVKDTTISLMSGPGTQYKIKWKYDKGFPLKVLSRKGKWLKVEDFEKDSGWVISEALSDKPSVIVKANKNMKGRVNIHTGPGTQFKVIGKAFYGVVFYALKQKNGWTKVLHDSGLSGWIKNTLLWGD